MDPDDGHSKGTLTFAIVAGNENNLFSIMSMGAAAGGRLTIAGLPLDFESKSSYVLTVAVSDNGYLGGSPVGVQVGQGNITVMLRDVNEYPTLEDHTFTVLENWNGEVGSGLNTSNPEPYQHVLFTITGVSRCRRSNALRGPMRACVLLT